MTTFRMCSSRVGRALRQRRRLPIVLLAAPIYTPEDYECARWLALKRLEEAGLAGIGNALLMHLNEPYHPIDFHRDSPSAAYRLVSRNMTVAGVRALGIAIRGRSERYAWLDALNALNS